MSEAGVTEEIDRPSAGTACVRCKAEKHWCAARVYAGDDPVCEACAAGEPCSQARAREEPPAFVPEDGHEAWGPVRTLSGEEIRAVEQKEREMANAKSFRLTDEQRAEIRGAPPHRTHAEVAREFGVSVSAVWNLRRASATAAAARQSEETPKPSPAAPTKQEPKREPKREDTRELVRVDPGAATVFPLPLSLEEGQLDRLWARCRPEQKATAIAAVFDSILTTLL